MEVEPYRTAAGAGSGREYLEGGVGVLRHGDYRAKVGAQMTECELFRQEGKEFRSVRVFVGPDGSVSMDTQDMGPFVEKTWGDDDYEFGVRVPAAAHAAGLQRGSVRR
jgi:hypothetical protein